MQPAPPAPGGLVLQGLVRRLVAGSRAPLPELALVAAQVTGGAAVVFQDPGGSPLRATAIAAEDAGEERALRLVVEGLPMPAGLTVAFAEANPELPAALLPSAWQAWVRDVAPVQSYVLPVQHGDHRVAWLWVGARLSVSALDPLRDLVAVAAMRHTLVTDPVDHGMDTLELEAQLAHRDDELEEANQTVDALASVVGHDVREAFRELLGWSRLSPDGDGDDELRADLMQKMRLGVERVGGILGDLLEGVAETQAGRRDVINIDLNGVVAWTTRVLHDRIDDLGVVMMVDTLPTIRTSATVVRRVVLELLRNAMDHGGTAIRVRSVESAEGVELLIEDNGPGIPEQDRDAMVGAGISTGAGAGMGLTRAHLLLQQVGGRLALTASASGGLQARVFLPAMARRA